MSFGSLLAMLWGGRPLSLEKFKCDAGDARFARQLMLIQSAIYQILASLGHNESGLFMKLVPFRPEGHR
jgi:hypothetical protein